MFDTVFVVQTAGPRLYEVTAEVAAWVEGRSGLLTLFVQHTSCSLLIQENADPSVQQDLLTWLAQFVPSADSPEMAYLTHTAEGPDDMPSHIKAAVLPVSVSIPVRDGRLALGPWQGIYLFEHRTRPHRRQIAAHLST